MTKIHDLLIIGAGPAAMSAALAALKSKLDFIMVARDAPEDYVSFVDHIPELKKYEFHAINYSVGYDLIMEFNNAVKENKIIVKRGEEATLIVHSGNSFSISTTKSSHSAKSIVIATGRRVKRIELKNAEKFERKGLGHCVFCDARMLSGRKVAVVCTGKEGIMSALFAAKIAEKVFIITPKAELSHTGEFAEIAKSLVENPKVELIKNAEPVELLGNEHVKGIVVRRFSDFETIPVDAVFVEVAKQPNSEFAKGLVKLNGNDEIEVHDNGATSCPGVFAAGDVTSTREKWLKAAAAGGKSAIARVIAYLGKEKDKSG
jgi:thioredoxin reductase